MGAVGQFMCRRYTSADALPSKEFSTSSRIVVYRAFPACADRTTCVVNGQEQEQQVTRTLSNPAMFWFSAKNSAGLLKRTVSSARLAALAAISKKVSCRSSGGLGPTRGSPESDR